MATLAHKVALVLKELSDFRGLDFKEPKGSMEYREIKDSVFKARSVPKETLVVSEVLVHKVQEEAKEIKAFVVYRAGKATKDSDYKVCKDMAYKDLYLKAHREPKAFKGYPVDHKGSSACKALKGLSETKEVKELLAIPDFRVSKETSVYKVLALRGFKAKSVLSDFKDSLVYRVKPVRLEFKASLGYRACKETKDCKDMGFREMMGFRVA